MVEKNLIQVPETWDSVKYQNPIYPTYSRGKFGKPLYYNNKYHCYSVEHSKPFYDVTAYQAPGLGFAERNAKYVPLTHIHDRTTPKPLKFSYHGSQIQQIYNSSLASIQCRQCAEEKVEPEESCRRYRTYDDESRRKVQEASGYERYKVHLINKLLRDQRAMLD